MCIYKKRKKYAQEDIITKLYKIIIFLEVSSAHAFHDSAK